MWLYRATLTACSSRVAAPRTTARSLSASAWLQSSDGGRSSPSRWGRSSGPDRRSPRGSSGGAGQGFAGERSGDRFRGDRQDSGRFGERFGANEGSDRRSNERPSHRSDNAQWQRQDKFGSQGGDSGPGDGNRNFYNRSERFAPDGSRKRPAHPNNRDRNPRATNDSQDRNARRYEGPEDRDARSFGDLNEVYINEAGQDPSYYEGARMALDDAIDSSDYAPSEIDRPQAHLRRSVRESQPYSSRYASKERDVLEEDEEESSPSKATQKSKLPSFGTTRRRESRKSVNIFADEDDPDYKEEKEEKVWPSQPRLVKKLRAQLAPGQFLENDKRLSPKFKFPKVHKEIFLPPTITVANLGQKLCVKKIQLEAAMYRAGYKEVRPDLILKYEDAELIAAEYFGATAVVEGDPSFDIVPIPPLDPVHGASLPLRPPIVTIMGHVDHGKTTLLDTLRKESTAKREPGGITQHIAAFSVPVAGRVQEKGAHKGHRGIQTITFLDTPGHSAFSGMRSRGAMMTDIVVLVVAADDGVMPQTLEVINLVKQSAAKATQSTDGSNKAVQLLVAINKVDKYDVDVDRVKRELLAAGVELEEFGGNVPCVEVSGRTGMGLDNFEETLAVMAEMAELRAENTGQCEGFVIDSRVDKGHGPVATVLLRRGVLKKKDPLIAGTAWCKVRNIIHSNNRPLAQALPSQPVIISGWRKLPSAGDQVLSGRDMIAVKRAVENREAQQTKQKLLEGVTQINEDRRVKYEQAEAESRQAFEEREEKRAARIAASNGVDPLAAMTATAAERESQETARDKAEEQLAAELEEGKEAEVEKKYLNLIIKADVSGSIEAVTGAIINIGNAEAGIKIISASAGEVTEADVTRAAALQGAILAFNVEPSRPIMSQASHTKPLPVQIIASDVIYRLMEEVKKSVSSLLTPKIEARVLGEASVSQVFDINIKGKRFKKIAGCKISNGSIIRSNPVRILRGPERKVVWQGKIDEFKHLKKDVTEMRKGTECGISFEDFQDVQPSDSIQSIIEVNIPRVV